LYEIEKNINKPGSKSSQVKNEKDEKEKRFY